KEVQFGAGGVLRRKLDIITAALGSLDPGDGPPYDLILGHVQLELAVNRAGRQEDVDARPGALLERLPCAVDVVVVAAGEAADHRPLYWPGDRLHCLEIAG